MKLGTSPSPGSYVLPSDFELSTKKGFQFGIGRDAYAKVYLESSPTLGTSAPGPGTYVADKTLGKSSPKFTMRVRTPNSELLPASRAVPGPGQYPMMPSINPKGSFVYSKYRNSAATLFNPVSSVRFKNFSNFNTIN